jgi:hypothetical protein
MSTEPADRDALIAEVRRRAGRRRLRRRAGFTAITAMIVAGAGIGIAGALAAGRTTSVRILGPGRTTTTTLTTMTVSPTTIRTPPTYPPPSSPPPLTLEDAPLVNCPTEYGTPPRRRSLPATVRLSVPAGLKDRVALYADGDGIIEMVAPSGWACRAVDAADGSTSIIVSPTTNSIPASGPTGWVLPHGDPTEALAAQETSACFGCTAGQACPLFPEAAQQMRANFGPGCSVRPVAERVFTINSGIDGFEDPPDVAGTATPSGGAFPADGVMTYYGTNPNGSWTETCTLPPAEHDLCTVSLNHFVAVYGRN